MKTKFIRPKKLIALAALVALMLAGPAQAFAEVQNSDMGSSSATTSSTESSSTTVSSSNNEGSLSSIEDGSAFGEKNSGASASSTSSAGSVTLRKGGMYFSLGAGPMLFESTHIFIPASGKRSNITYNTGFQVGAHVGFQATEFLASELELLYNYASYNKLSEPVGKGDARVRKDVDGHLSHIMAFANVIVTPTGDIPYFTPYFGAGAGLAYEDRDVSAFTLNGVRQDLGNDYKKKAIVPALKAIAGFDIPIAEGFRIGLRYEFMGIFSASNFSKSDPTHGGKIKNLGAHALTAQLSLALQSQN